MGRPAAMRYVREHFHPLFHLRKWSVGRKAIRAIDGPAWLSPPKITFPVRGQRITHGLAFATVGSQEQHPEALALACVARFGIQAFWDVGANVGYYTWLLKSASPHLRAVLFEPLQANYELIQQTLEHNSLTDLQLVTAGVSDHPGAGKLHTDSIAGATSSLESCGNTFERRHYGVVPGVQEIRLVSLDAERPRLGAVDFVKIDVEDHEAAVIRGAANTIASDQPILFIECAHPGKPCLRPLISKFGYTVIDADRLSPDLSDESTDFFCFPQRLQSSISALLEDAGRATKH